jgi:uncharacterized protein YciI
MLYMLICKDRAEGGFALRMETRPDHLAYLESLGPKLRVGGALLSEDAKEPRGSIIIVEVGSLAEAEAIASADPYAKAGVFADVEIHPFCQSMGAASLG